MQRRYQLGMSSLGIMMAAIIFAFAVKVAATVAPAYYDNYTINRIVASVFRDGHGGSVEDFKRSLDDRFSINDINEKKPDDFVYTFEDKKLTVEINYEVRRNFVANLDVVMSFKKTHTASGATSAK